MNGRGSNVVDFLLDGKEPARIALHLIGKEHTYGDLSAGASDIARYLLRIGGEKGDRVILASDTSLFWVSAYLGILRAGLVCVPLPADITPQDLVYILETTEAKIVFADAGFAMRNRSYLRQLHVLTDRAVANVPEAASQRAFEALRFSGVDAAGSLPLVQADDLAALMFTSGSTGKPRGVMVSHGNIIANTTSIIEYLELTAADRIMAVLPFHYCFGTSLLHTHLWVGGSLVVDSRFMYPEVILQRMADTQCTGFAGVPSHFQVLLRRSSLSKRRFPHLRYVQQAGGHLAPAFVRELQAALPDTQIFVMYGQTEATARLSYLPPALLGTKLGSIGKGIPGVTLRVLNDAGEPVRIGEVGEIVAEGANIAAGYWRAPDDSAVSFRDGKLHTGDLAEVDEDGFIYVVGRRKDFLKCGGKRVSCRQVEEQLLRFDGLVEAAVIGMADEVLGEAVKAFVVPRDGDGAGFKERLHLFCKEHMPLQLVPKDIVVLRALPKNSGGKVMKQDLKERSSDSPDDFDLTKKELQQR